MSEVKQVAAKLRDPTYAGNRILLSLAADELDRLAPYEILQNEQDRGKQQMTGLQFIEWLAEMKAAGLARSDAECARMLGKSDDTVVSYKKRGTDRTVALACRALLHRLEAYGG